MILLDNASKEFQGKNGVRVPALCPTSLHIPEGTLLGLIGRSGAGKTTLLKLAAGLLQPSSGRIRIGGCDPVADKRRLRGQIYMLSAEHENLDSGRSVAENLAMLPFTYALEQEKFGKKQQELMRRFDLSDKMDTKVRDLSLGYHRRAEVAMALLTPAKILLMDEPGIGMDAKAKEVFAKLLMEERARGRTILLSSHDITEIQNVSDRILLLDQGKVIFYGERERLYQKMAPENKLFLKLAGRYPDLQDLPYIRYEQEDDHLILTYDSSRVTAAELLQGILQSGIATKVSVIRPDLSEVITKISSGKGEERK